MAGIAGVLTSPNRVEQDRATNVSIHSDVAPCGSIVPYIHINLSV